MSGQTPEDAAWRPPVPTGHTNYTWGSDDAAAFLAAQAGVKAPGAAAAAAGAGAGPDVVERKHGVNPSASSSAAAAAADDGTFNHGQGSRDPLRPVVLPVKGKRNVLITSALPYVNNVPHLGNIIGCVLSGDVYARFCRQRGYNSIYICGTDEYGTATETKAQQEGLTPQQICDKYNAIHRKVYDWFDISFDYFGRTSTDKQTAIAQDIFNHCQKNGFVRQDSLDQLYCKSCARFLADRFVAGTCPLPGCGYIDAKGDQCDKCGQLIDAVTLINPVCTVCKSTPEVRTSNHLFLDLPAIEDKLRAYVEDKKRNWSDNSYMVTQSWFKTGLKPRCITRDLKWGTPVPMPGYEDKVFYVWFDAPIGYISITANYTDDWAQWWKNPEDVELVQFMGKDNVPFHTVIFPSTLIAAADNYTMLTSLPTTEYLNYEGTKFSKTRGTGVFGDSVMETGIPADVWRYYLLANRPEVADTMFTWDDLLAKTNADLNNTLGNLVNRVLGFTMSKFESKVPDFAGGVSAISQAEMDLEVEIGKLLAQFIGFLDRRAIKDALKIALDIAMAGNKFVTVTQPWGLFKTDKSACGRAIYTLIQLVSLLATIFEPFMPNFARQARKQLNIAAPCSPWEGIENNAWSIRASVEAKEGAGSASCLYVPAGHTIGTPSPLFAKIDAATIEALRKRFSGLQHAQAAASGAEQKSDGPDFPLDAVVGLIKEAKVHPTNPKLYVLSIDCKEAAPRQVISGLVDAYAIDAIVGRSVVLLVNLKPSKFGGVESQGMVLTAIGVTASGTRPYVLSCKAPIGTKVVPKGSRAAPVKAFDVKAKMAGLQLHIGADHIAFAGAQPLEAAAPGDAAEPVTCAEVEDGSRIA